MSSAGLFATVYEDGKAVGDCLIIGREVPRLHHSDGIPVYLVVAHDDGVPVTLLRPDKHGYQGRTVKLLAYPSAWPAIGGPSGRVVFAKHERLRWSAPIPLFDVEE